MNESHCEAGKRRAGFRAARQSNSKDPCDGVCSAAEAEEALVVKEAVHGGVRLAALAHEAGQGDDVSLSGHLAVLVHLDRHAQLAECEGGRPELGAVASDLLEQFRSGRRRGP